MSTPHALHRAIVCVDIERFTDARIADWQRADMRTALYRALERAFVDSRIPWDESYSEDRGDGAFFLVHPDVPTALLVERLPFELAAELARHNKGAGDGQVRLRLRVSVNAGEVRIEKKGRRGVVGTPLNLAFRLLDAPELKAALRTAEGDVVFIASNWFYHEVIRNRRSIGPAAYQQVQVTLKEGTVDAWICASDVQLTAGRAYGERLPAIETALDSVAATLAEASRHRAVIVRKIASSVPEVPELDDELTERLATLRELRGKSRWTELLDELTELEKAVDAAAEQAQAVHRAVVEPLDRRDELRGRLGAYQAMAGKHGHAEDPELDELYRRAYDLLWTAPCDLVEAEAATMRYVQASQRS
ncbi:MAG TPA: hypothetical protein VFU43_10810 [Streptosporangiaceae bacterium]|nr:hypothetical protein [Streptosporangiaceae bacterium]